MFTEDKWKQEEGIDVSSDEGLYDSDQIDSDVEAELYSVIHHETDNSTIHLDDSLNTSKIVNSSTSLRCEELGISNINSNCVQIIEVADSTGDKILGSPIEYNVTNSNPIKRESNYQIKRKSNSDEIFLDDAQPCSKKQNTSQLRNSTFGSKSYETVSSSSSDDDNDIICLKPSDKLTHFETNLSQSIVIDSDSDSADSWCFKSTNNTSTPSANTKDLWFVNNDDLYRSRRNSNRYHESQFSTCTRCNQKGHSSKFCSFSKNQKCFVCGGNHNSYRCRNKTCAKCFGIGHDIKYCPKPIDFCEMCQMPGHHHRICPDLWRRFQRTTPKKKKAVVRLKQDKPFFCYNCGLPGHFGALCKGPRMNFLCFTTWPFVLNCIEQKSTKVKSKLKPAITAFSEESFVADKQQELFPKKKTKKKKKKNVPSAVDMQQISFPRTPKNSQTKTQNETNSFDNETLRQEIRKARNLRRRQSRKENKLKKKARASN